MSNFFNDDFIDFLKALQNNQVKYLLVGGYAVIMNGYVRSTADMDVWIDKTEENYSKLSKAFFEFGAPIFSKKEFLGSEFDVWAIGREPNKIEILTTVKGIEFNESFNTHNLFDIGLFKVPFINLPTLIKAKEAAGRHKDKADIEELKKKNNDI
jgi:hypothetical protein